jgi:hypothetical protein
VNTASVSLIRHGALIHDPAAHGVLNAPRDALVPIVDFEDDEQSPVDLRHRRVYGAVHDGKGTSRTATVTVWPTFDPVDPSKGVY